MDNKIKIKVEDNECFIPQEALALASFASKENSRPILKGLHIANGKAETADGFCTGSYKVTQGKEFPECVISMADILRAGIDKRIKGITISMEDGIFIIKGEYELITHLLGTSDFPKTDKLYNATKELKTDAYLGLSTFVLKKLITALEKSGHKMVALRIRQTNNKLLATAIEFCSTTNSSDVREGSGKLTGLIMPCYIYFEKCNWVTGKEGKSNG